jgi:hypothetical protein
MNDLERLSVDDLTEDEETEQDTLGDEGAEGSA